MNQPNKIDTSLLDNIIIGRVEPKIYAFTTETVPNYIKIGDTYRPIETRLDEWRKYFPNLEKKFDDVAKVDDDVFFRDHAVHSFLENEIKKERLKPGDIKNIPYYSKEFFKDTKEKDINNAIKDIKDCHKSNDNKYQYYEFDNSHIPITHTYKRVEDYKPRPNQEKTIKKFVEAVNQGRENLLMYAVMRFGKSFTSMCCATKINANIVLIVSAKADVKEEWKNTVESHKKFEGYVFYDSNSLLEDNSFIKKVTKRKERAVVFLTLQDLQGDNIKNKHKDIFGNKIDLLIIDETHFGARAAEYGKVLRNTLETSEDSFSQKDLNNELKLNESSLEELNDSIKIIDAKVRLHLSGTPYRILMNSEFTDEDIIAFYQFSNIAEDQEEWDKNNLHKDETKEWDNPYYGFPQMVRFAFNPNSTSLKKMEDMKKKGITYTFSALFKPLSINKDTKSDLHKKFKYEKEVIDLLNIIDGSKNDENILGFLDYQKIKEGKMCRHIVCVLPYRASCDALEELMAKNSFRNLSEYEVINISGVDGGKNYKYTQSVQRKIKDCEKQNKKTITLTVNRMLTGSTVPEWDTMIYLKDTASPQEYDQAIFRLQNQYIRTYRDSNGDTVKYNMKPQTLLVDFNPARMFEMQEQKSQIYNVNIDSNGNSKLEERIARELQISPIIVLNNKKITQIQPADILDAVRQYSSSRSVVDEARSIAIDYSLLDIPEIKEEIERQNKIGSRQGLEIKSAEGEGEDLDIENTSEEDGDIKESINQSVSDKEDLESDFRDRFAMFYARILFYSFLTDSRVSSLGEIINDLDKDKNNQRIINNIGISKKILLLFRKHVSHFVLSGLDYKIQNINSLANDLKLEPVQRAGNAMRKFSRLSDSEIVTPEEIAGKIINTLPEKSISKSTKLLDVASKQGEFVYAIHRKFGKEVAGNVYSIPTSKIAYEFTRKVYKLLNLDVKKIEESYTSYDLIEKNDLIRGSNVIINNTSMKFNVIIGNPPYQQSDGGAQASAKPIYNHFVNISKKLDPDYISMIMPTRWYSGGKGLDDFRDDMLNDKKIVELHDFVKPSIVFKDINLRGGVCYFLWSKKYDNTKNKTKVFTYRDDLDPKVTVRSLKTEGVDVFVRHGVSIEILNKVKNHHNFKSFEKHISSRKPFGFGGDVIKNKNIFRFNNKNLKDPVICYGRGKKVGYIDRSEVTKNKEWIDEYKVFSSYANNIGTELNDDNLNTFIGGQKTICTESYILIGIGLDLKKISSQNLCKYFSTKFARFMHSLVKTSQHGTSKTYKFVPLQDFSSKSDIDWSKPISEIDKQLYKKYKLTKSEIEFIENNIKPME